MHLWWLGGSFLDMLRMLLTEKRARPVGAGKSLPAEGGGQPPLAL